MIPQKLSIPLFYELEKERGHTHQLMQISKAKNVEYVGIMEDKLTKMGRDLANIILREVLLKDPLEEAQVNNVILNGQLHQKDKHIVTMEDLCMEEI